jgi:hypothetical protein
MKSEFSRKRDVEDENNHERNKRIHTERERRLRKELRHLDRITKHQGDHHA